MEKSIHNLTYTLVMIQLGLCILDGNIRVEIDNEEIRRLGDSLLKRQIHPIILLDNGNNSFAVIDGGKRLRAARAVGMTELLAAVTTERLTPEEIREIQLTCTFHRSDPSAVDKWRAMEAVKSAHGDWTNAKIADHLSIDPKMVKVLLSPGQLIAEAREAFIQGKIGISDCYVLSLQDTAHSQMKLLQKKLAGASRDAIAQAGRKQRSGNGTFPAAKAGKLRIPLPSGVIITVAGEELSLEDAIHELSEALAEMRKAEKQNLDIKTFQAICRDRAKAGV